MEEYRSILENLKNKNVRGLESLSNKYFREFIISTDEKYLKKSVIAKGLSYIVDMKLQGNPEQLFYENVEFINDAKEVISIKLHSLGYSYSRIAEMLSIDILNIINRTDIQSSHIEIPDTIYLDQSSIAFLTKTNMLDIFDMLDVHVVTYINSKDIRTRAIHRNRRIQILDPNPYQYRPFLYISGKPIYNYSLKEIGFYRGSDRVFSIDENLMYYSYMPKERIENYTNRTVMVDEEGLREFSEIVRPLPLSYLISHAITRGYDIGSYDRTIYID
ncbi:MAG: hypothetical protein N3C61_01480 [Candidatus Micrarchaeota archaeon]|nr:hypothetical protein [Candidatus Micrarchaeota archaeon]